MADVFISYKAEDRARVKPLVDAFEAAGLSVWWDVHIEGGAAWRAAIQDNLDTARCVVVIWSEHSVGRDGQFVHDEASRAHRRGVYLPIAIDRVDPPLGFGQEHVLRLIDWRGDPDDPFLKDVLASARSIIDGGPRARPSARATISRGRKGAPWRGHRGRRAGGVRRLRAERDARKAMRRRGGQLFMAGRSERGREA